MAGRATKPQLIEALDALPEGFVLFDENDRILFFNETFKDMFPSVADLIKIGISYEELLRAQVARGQIDAAKGREEEWLAERMAAHRNPKAPVEQAFVDGRVIRLTEIKSPSGYIVSIRTDITDLARARHSAWESEENYRNLAELSPAAAIVQVDGKIVHANQSACRILRARSVDELVGLEGLAMVHPDYREAILERRNRILETGEVAPYQEFRHLRMDGSSFPSEMIAGPIDWRGRAGTMNIILDITERKEAEKALIESERRMSDFAESSVDWFWEMDRDFRYVYLSSSASDSVGTAVENFYGRTQWEVLGDEFERQDSLHHIRDCMRQGRPFRDVVFWRTHADGTRRVWIRTSGMPVFDGHGAYVGYRGSSTDITEAKMLAEQLSQAQKMEAVGQLTGGVAHDFNNLLSIIMGNLELQLEILEDGSEAYRNAERALNATRRGAELTHRLLAFSRRQPLSPVPIDVNRMIEGIRDLLVRAIGQAVEIRFSLGPDLWSCEADISQLEHAILNLAINARDAMPGGGKLIIETANAHLDDAYAAGAAEVDPGQYVIIAVSDTGTGMAPDVVTQAFEPFFTTKDVGKGSGLGLSMVYGFVKQSGGHARIYSEVGQGTTIKIYLPRRTGPGAVAVVDERPVADTAGRGETILVVENDEELRAVTAAALAQMGYRIVEAGHGAEALGHIDGGAQPDLLLVDVVLPGGMSGRDLVDRAMGTNPRLKVLYMSGHSEDAIMHHGRLDHGVRLLEKPFSRADLATSVRRTLDQP